MYIPSGIELAFICNVSGIRTRLNLQQRQSYGLDIGTNVATTPYVQIIIKWGGKMLQGAM
jgi:hypothetical protein